MLHLALVLVLTYLNLMYRFTSKMREERGEFGAAERDIRPGNAASFQSIHIRVLVCVCVCVSQRLFE